MEIKALQFFNFTGFASSYAVMADKNGYETLLVIVKATYDISKSGMPTPAEQQPDVLMADEHHEAPDSSSIRLESDLAVFKPFTDVVLIGHAYNKNPRSGYVDVNLRFNNVAKTVRVFGDRYWKKGLFGYSISKPAPFEKIPLRYELAYGGCDDSLEQVISEPRNPVGIGFFTKKSKKTVNGSRLPNLEDPRNLIKKPWSCPNPASFGVVSRGWEPRKSLAGNFGPEWQKSRMPLLPADFDEKYYNGASSGLMLDRYIKGDENIEVINASQSGYMRCVVPKLNIESVIGNDYNFEAKDIVFDTVIIDGDKESMALVGRTGFNVQSRLYDINFIKTQHKNQVVLTPKTRYR